MLTETGPHGDHKRTHTRDKLFHIREVSERKVGQYNIT